MAKKETKKKATKKSGKRAGVLAPRTTTIVFQCLDETCEPSTGQHTRIGEARSKVRLIAGLSDDVTIEFLDEDTGLRITPPFTNKKNPIPIAKGKHVDRVVRDDAEAKSYPYTVSCSSCRGQLSNQPEMIVP